MIHKGEILFTKTKDELIETYGIAKCSEENFHKMAKEDYLRYKKNRYDYEILVENKIEFQKKYNVEVMDKASLEEIMLLYSKGEKSCME